MKTRVVAAGAALAAAGALGLGIPAAVHAHHQQVALTASDGLGSINDTLLSLEGISSPAAALPATPLGTVADGNFYDVITSGTVTDGNFSPTDSTLAAHDLLNSSLITGANQLAGIGYTNGYIGLSPTETAGSFVFSDQEGVAFDHGLQALLTAFNQPFISLEGAINGVEHLVDPTAAPLFDPAALDLDPAQLVVNSGFGEASQNLPDVVNASLTGDFATALQDFGVFGGLAGGLAAPAGDLSTIFGDLLALF